MINNDMILGAVAGFVAAVFVINWVGRIPDRMPQDRHMPPWYPYDPDVMPKPMKPRRRRPRRKWF